MGTSIHKGGQARSELAVLFVQMGWKYPVELPDISTKDKAQEFIGLDMEFLIEDKQNFLNSTAVDWDKNARERQGTLKEYKQSD